MAWMKRTAVGLVVAVLLVGTGAAVYVQRSFAVVDGKLSVAGLRDVVRVQRDGADVTHIRAQTPQDVWFAMGFVHAQERTWQLEFNRRVMRGAAVGSAGPGHAGDRQTHAHAGHLRTAQRQWEGLPPYAREALQAYSDGINAFFAKTARRRCRPSSMCWVSSPGGDAGATGIRRTAWAGRS